MEAQGDIVIHSHRGI